jgi:hypothetical protein
MGRSVLFVVGLALLLATQPFRSSAQTRAAQTDDLLKQARAALGGEARLRRVQSLSAVGQLRRVFPDRERAGTLELNWLSPDKFRQVETMGLAGDVKISLTSVLDGARAWKESTVDTGSLPITVTQPAGRARPITGNEQRQLRANFARYLPALLLSAAAPGRINDAGATEVDGAPARVLAVRTEDGFAAQLYLDAKTHLPLMLSYRGRPPVVALGAQGSDEPDRAQETELRVRFADYRAVDGLLWPHRITTEAAGRLLEALELKSYKLNPEDINPQSFGRE